MLFIFDPVSDWYKTQEILDRVVSEDSYMLIYCPYRYKTPDMCNEDVDDFMAALKFVSDWFVASKMLEKFHDDFSKVSFFANKMSILRWWCW